MAPSSSRRARRNEKPNKRQPSRSSSSASSFTAPTYRVEENSRGELVNKETGVKWPTRVHAVKKYPDYSSDSSLVSSDAELLSPSSASSPYENLDTTAERGRSEKRAADRRKSRTGSAASSAYSSEYIDLMSGSVRSEKTDQSTTRIDSVVFDTAEELARYQRLFRKAPSVSSRSSASNISVTSIASSAVITPEQADAERHYIGVRSRRTVDRKLTPGDFLMYYDKPSAGPIPVSIELKIGYMSSAGQIFHFPIQRFECQGESYYAVMHTERDVKMFPSIASLVQHYHTFSNVHPASGRLETFGTPV